jgi:hypothetical protein
MELPYAVEGNGGLGERRDLKRGSLLRVCAREGDREEECCAELPKEPSHWVLRGIITRVRRREGFRAEAWQSLERKRQVKPGSSWARRNRRRGLQVREKDSKLKRSKAAGRLRICRERAALGFS